MKKIKKAPLELGLKKNIINSLSINELVLTWKDESDKFREISQPYRIYK